MEKSPEAFRTISEVADFLETPAHVLRFWESRFPQIRPVKRAGGRRYYRPGDVALLAGIKRLLHDEGMTIRGVQKILREHGIRHVAGMAEGFSGDTVEASADPLGVAGLFRPDLPETDAEPAIEESRSAQIISLEAALGRTEQPMPPEAALWPQDPLDQPDETGDPGLWPTDPLDENPALGTASLISSEPPAVEQGEASGELSRPEPEPIHDEKGTVADTPDLVPASPIEETSSRSEETAADADRDMPAQPALAPEGMGSESSEGNATTEPAAVADHTVAALLRRRTLAQMSAHQDDLVRLRDRLFDLRNRVAEAARRRAR